MWIYRDFEPFFNTTTSPLRIFPVWLVLGPRQVGKSSLLKKCSESNRQYVTFDDIQVRLRAKQDPAFFIKSLRLPFCIDEIQYVPEILSEIKLLADEHKVPGGIWLTGSQNFDVMKGVQESLAGRVAILNLFGLTDHEKKIESGDIQNYFARILETNFPQIHDLSDSQARSLYLSSYIQTYIERDVRELLGIEKRYEFEVFLKICAFRTGQLVNYEDLARDSGISPSTAKHWLSLLQDSFIIKILHPWYQNKTKRLIKTPKLYFLDMGLAAFLMGWQTADQIRFGANAGAIFESHIVSNIHRHLKHHLKTFEMYFWRTKDQAEIDLLIEKDGVLTPIEIKMGTVNPSNLTPLKKGHIQKATSGYVVSLTANETPTAASAGWSLVRPEWLYGHLLENWG